MGSVMNKTIKATAFVILAGIVPGFLVLSLLYIRLKKNRKVG